MAFVIEFFAGIAATLMWVPFGIAALFVQATAPFTHAVVQGMTQPGVVFSVKQAESFGEDPMKMYDAILTDLHPKYIRLIAYWDRIEKNPGVFDFSELDQYVKKAEQDHVLLTLIVGRKVPRWPECHIPQWAQGLDQQDQEKALDSYLTAFVNHYKDSSAVELWQVENEPFLNFGPCQYPPEVADINKEIALVHALDRSHPVIVTASGELETWLRPFMAGDIVGTSLYRRFFVTTPWFRIGLNYPLPPLFYQLKARLYQLFYPGKQFMVTELQLEPWLPISIAQAPLDMQFKELPFSSFEEYIDYARQTGIARVYLWGVEWWYWLAQHGHSEYWNYVRDSVFAH